MGPIVVIYSIQVIAVAFLIHHQSYQINHFIQQLLLLIIQVILVKVRNKFVDMVQIVVIYPIQAIAVAFLIHHQIYQVNHSIQQLLLPLINVVLVVICSMLIVLERLWL